MLLGTAALVTSMLRPGFTAQAPGALRSPAWRNAVHKRFERTDAYVLEDRDAVYVAFAAIGGQNDPNDAVRVYLWSDKRAYAFVVDSHGKRNAWCSAGSAALPRWSAQEQGTKGGYAVVIRLPRAFFSGPQSRWLAQFARVLPQHHLAFTWPQSQDGVGNVIYSSRFDGLSEARAGGRRNSPTVTVAGRKGVAVAQTTDNVAFSAMAAQSGDGSQETFASLAWTSPDDRVSAGLKRDASAARDATSVSQSLALDYDNGENLRVSADLAAQGGSGVKDVLQATAGSYEFSLYGGNGSLDMRWNTAGPQYDPSGDGAPAAGTAGYTLSASRKFGSVEIDADADRYRDEFGKLFSANQRAEIAAPLSPALALDVSAAANASTPYTTLPYFQDTAGLRYSEEGRQASLSFHEERLGDGNELASLSAGFTLPLFARGRSVSFAYQNMSGNANVTFSFEDRLPVGLLRATYYSANPALSAPVFSLKFVQL